MTIQAAVTIAINKGWKPVRVWLAPNYINRGVTSIYGIPVTVNEMLRRSRVVCENGETVEIV